MALMGVEKFAILLYLIAGVSCTYYYGEEFSCKNSRSIRTDQFCDGHDDCGDGSDESYGCDVSKCGKGKFACNDSLCVSISARCNAIRDCSDGSDELNCYKEYFQCKNGNHIGRLSFCDMKRDCADGSDEAYGCTPYYCGPGKFSCNNGLCLPISARCDGKKECATDEMECEHIFGFENCTQQNGKYLCKDNLGCISLANVCQGTKKNGCIDGSEENINCYDPVDTCDLTCPHACWRSPAGPLCFCNSTDSSQQSLCKKVEDCDSVVDKGEQRCVKFDGVIQRSCNEGYTQHGGSDGLCVSEAPYENMLLYSDQRNIVGYDMTKRRKVFIQNDNNVTSIFAANNYIYWSTFSNNVSKIFKTKMLSQRREAKTIYSNSRKNSVITCIAVDWISNNIFFTSQTTLSVCNDDGSACAQLKYSTYGIECVALLPRKGLMFWIENTENKYSGARILKSSMDGSDEQVLVDKNLLFSNNLVVDESSERLYWMDGESVKIESIKYNGKQRKIVVPKAWSTAFFTVFEGLLYHTMKFDNAIFRGMDDNTWLTGDSNIKRIHIFNFFLQNTKESNPCENSSCTGLCLLRPTTTKSLNCSCKCSNVLKNSSPGEYKRWCLDPVVNTEEETGQSPSESTIPSAIPQSGSGHILLYVVFLTVVCLSSSGFYFVWRKWFAENEITKDVQYDYITREML